MEPDTAIHAYPFHAIITRLITPLPQITDRLRTLLNSVLSVFEEISKGGFSSSDAQCPQCEKQLSLQQLSLPLRRQYGITFLSRGEVGADF